MAANFQTVAEQFVKYYYDTFDTNRSGLSALYRDNSMLTFEAAPTQGTAAIIEKLVGLPFSKVQHRVDSMDAQPSSDGGDVIVMVTGALLVDEEQRAMSYVQLFNLKQEGGNYFVFNDVFRLVYPAA